MESSDTAKSFETVDDKGVVYLYRRGRAVGAAVATQIEIEPGQLYFVEQNQRIGLSSGRVQIDIRDEATGMAAV